MVPGTIAVKNFPTSSPYSTDILNTYEPFTRAKAKAFRIPAKCYPSFDPTRRRKNWLAFDVNDSKPNIFHTYETVDEGDVSQLVLPAVYLPFTTRPGQAGKLNLPDVENPFPFYLPTPTDAYENDGGNKLSMNSIFLATEAQAKYYSNLMGNGKYTEYQPAPGTSGYRYIYPADELRRYWQFIDKNNQLQTVGILLGDQNGYGYGDGVGREGAPGNWVNLNGQWVFKFDPLPVLVIPTGPIYQIPQRQLIDTESFIVVDLGMMVMIQNSALQTRKGVKKV